MRILLVEDDWMIGESTCKALGQDTGTVDWVRDGVDAELALTCAAFDVLLLDLGLPTKSGMDVLKDLRRRGDTTPVVILTAHDATADRVAGLDAGADDYVVKPFDLDELAARVRAVVRRRSGRASPLLEIGDLVVDPKLHEVTYKGKKVDASPKEFAVLHALAAHMDTTLSREQLEEQLYGWNDEVESNTVEVHIHRLRRKLSPQSILTVRGVGYRLSETP